ncbi:MAG: type III pantothenate kinase [Hydrogenovibrio crunogenus]|uniref:Type III pantothenate kinase n=1 Tax=Hydrogenovibrio crunogenus (strain DSM 25203 / XCL-2) TaxID=317025 RepID=COAX_HYDCU|nr:RecName: Full=Type III pantothenate kinase; AltName: Full=PanK-III; AltName: Full=Pantothenic acid kinase [Hydrogenovibrio crunogenus XCL-2]MBD3612348.1 type III pantothenate kinase [Hydrogenovibrio crunogenus]
MLIFFELGNSQLKAATILKGNYQFLGSVRHDAILSGEFIESFNLNEQNPTAVYVSSVAPSQLNAALTEVIQQHFKLYPTFLATQPSCCGIECGYEKFDQFGVDRWMAILGACSGSNKPTFIVDAGTALTVDAVIDKKHIGGFIVPGLGLMRDSLLKNTALSEQSLVLQSVQDGLLAKDTAGGVMGGTLYMLGSYLNSLLVDLELETGRKFDCIGTGGDFLSLKPVLDKPYNYVEDLTLRGMKEVIESL